MKRYRSNFILIFIILFNGVNSQGWIKQAGGTAFDYGTTIALDKLGNTIIAGHFSETATFGAGEPNQTILTSAGSFDMFIAKYSTNGLLIWAKQAGGTEDCSSSKIKIDNSNNILVTGNFSGTATFGVSEPNQTILTSSGSSDIFIAKYSSNGSLIWAKQASGTGYDWNYGGDIDTEGNILVTGIISGTTTFGAGESNQTILTPAGGGNIFIAKYNTNGLLVWAKQAGGTGNDFGFDIGIDGSDNVWITGRFDGLATFGAGEPNQTILTSSGSSDMFFAKLDKNGSLIFVKQTGNVAEDGGDKITIDNLGNIIVSGYFTGMVAFGAGEPNQTILTSIGSGLFPYNHFMAKYDSNGLLQWVKQTFAKIDPGVLLTDNLNNIILADLFQGTITLGSGEPNETTLVSIGEWSSFFAKYDLNGSLLWVKQIQSSSTILSQPGISDISINPTGNMFLVGGVVGVNIFGPGEVNQTTVTSWGSADIYLAKFDSNGNLLLAPPPSLSISGHVRDSTGNGIEGVSVSFSNGGATVMTNATGHYSTSVLSGWSGTSSANKSGYNFTPTMYTYTPVTSDQTSQDFTATALPSSVSISGQIKDSMNVGVEGVDVTFDNGGATVTTDQYGRYVTSVSYGWNGTSTPYKDGWLFTPTQLVYPQHLTTNQVDQDFLANDFTLSVEDLSSAPTSFTVLPAYPNPFNPNTTITYGLNTNSDVTIQIYDISGMLISTLQDNNQSQGWHTVKWDGTTNQGTQVPAGIYLSRITSNHDVKTAKLMLLK